MPYGRTRYRRRPTRRGGSYRRTARRGVAFRKRPYSRYSFKRKPATASASIAAPLALTPMRPEMKLTLIRCTTTAEASPSADTSTCVLAGIDTGQPIYLNRFIMGADEVSRIGRRTLNLGIEILGHIYRYNTGITAGNYGPCSARLMLIRFNKQESKTLTLTDVLDTTTPRGPSGTGGLPLCHAFPSTLHAGDFTILIDRLINFPTCATGATTTAGFTDSADFPVHITKVMRSYSTFLNTAGQAGYAQCEAGGLWLALIGSSGVAYNTAGCPYFYGTIRLRWIDA